MEWRRSTKADAIASAHEAISDANRYVSSSAQRRPTRSRRRVDAMLCTNASRTFTAQRRPTRSRRRVPVASTRIQMPRRNPAQRRPTRSRRRVPVETFANVWGQIAQRRPTRSRRRVTIPENDAPSAARVAQRRPTRSRRRVENVAGDAGFNAPRAQRRPTRSRRRVTVLALRPARARAVAQRRPTRSRRRVARADSQNTFPAASAQRRPTRSRRRVRPVGDTSQLYSMSTLNEGRRDRVGACPPRRSRHDLPATGPAQRRPTRSRRRVSRRSGTRSGCSPSPLNEGRRDRVGAWTDVRVGCLEMHDRAQRRPTRSRRRVRVEPSTRRVGTDHRSTKADAIASARETHCVPRTGKELRRSTKADAIASARVRRDQDRGAVRLDRSTKADTIASARAVEPACPLRVQARRSTKADAIASARAGRSTRQTRSSTTALNEGRRDRVGACSRP